MEAHAASVTNSREQLVVALVGTWDRDSAKEAVIALAAITTRGHEQVVGIMDSQAAGRHCQLGRISALVSDILKRTEDLPDIHKSGIRGTSLWRRTGRHMPQPENTLFGLTCW